MAKSKLRVTKKYIVNEGLPNEAIYDEVEDAFWVKDGAGDDLEYHVAKWQGKYGILDWRGGIVIPFDYTQWQVLCIDEYVLYVAMTVSIQGNEIATDIFSVADWSVCLKLDGKPILSVEMNYNKIPYILAYSYYHGMNITTVYNLKMNTQPGWEYVGDENVIKNMYSLIIDKSKNSWDRDMYGILSANGDAYQINDRLGIKAYDGEFSKKDILPRCVYTMLGTFMWELISVERYSTRKNGVNVSSQNTFLLQCKLSDCAGTEDPVYRNCVLVLIPTDVKNCNYQLADCLIDEFDKSKSDLTSKEIEQYIIW